STTPLAPLPVSEGHWLLQNIPSMAKNILTHFYDREQELGTTYLNPAVLNKIIATSEPDFMRYVLQTNHRNYKKGKAYDVLKLVLGNGLVTSNGKFWQKQRRLAQPAFHKKNLEDLFNAMGDTAKAYFQTLEDKRNKEVDIAREMMTVTAQIALKALFSDNTEEDLNAVYDSMTEAQRYITDILNNPMKLLYFPFTGRKRQFQKDLTVLNEVVLKAIDKRRKSDQKYPDLLQMMMDATYEDSNEQMDDQQLMDEMITIFSAGHETSANGLAWTLHLLAQHPEIVAKMRKEIAQVVGDRLPNFQELRQLTYVRQVIDEGMRLFPPVWAVSRTAIEDDEYRGIKIKADSIIFCLIYNAHRREDLFENATQFDPDRFTPDKMKDWPKMSYLPFGAGPRLCIGNLFAIMEMQLLLVGLLQRFDFELVANQNIDLEGLITLRPRYGIKMILR
ncbi:MAG: cytochrome P450, partial [Bacteroidota bacterium]